ncbi:MAG: hypothetical protein E7129_07470 [Rikenellaceae bacterium]|nr:hypothetical protein [Rikenellaceae bacterium]
MRRFFTILLLLLGAIACGQVEFISDIAAVECEVVDLHHEQLLCNHRHNIDIERTSTVVMPSVRTITSNSLRQAQQRASYMVDVERLRIVANYPISYFAHRLGSCARAVDFYLYILCQLRL